MSWLCWWRGCPAASCRAWTLACLLPWAMRPCPFSPGGLASRLAGFARARQRHAQLGNAAAQVAALQAKAFTCPQLANLLWALPVMRVVDRQLVERPGSLGAAGHQPPWAAAGREAGQGGAGVGVSAAPSPGPSPAPPWTPVTTCCPAAVQPPCSSSWAGWRLAASGEGGAAAGQGAAAGVTPSAGAAGQVAAAATGCAPPSQVLDPAQPAPPGQALAAQPHARWRQSMPALLGSSLCCAAALSAGPCRPRSASFTWVLLAWAFARARYHHHHQLYDKLGEAVLQGLQGSHLMPRLQQASRAAPPHPRCFPRCCAHCMQLEEEAAIESQKRWGTHKQLVVFFGNVGIGWGVKAVLQAYRNVVERPNSGKPTDKLLGKVVTLDEFCTSRVSSAMNSPQPCEAGLDRSKPTRPPGVGPHVVP
ncbi:hypothetical protein HaLaN_15491 [Haematococcus lacustris]|uniref:Uncharacterized protein n=1 Tax=Haematococcus lacustris TaxID=44745 RepID=A0A699Z8Z4_HAELA|nr:hypothetical protein HaLaN_15491 [Haematococcus lacustris]